MIKADTDSVRIELWTPDDVKAHLEQIGIVISRHRVARAMRAGPHRIVARRLYVEPSQLPDIIDRLTKRTQTWRSKSSGGTDQGGKKPKGARLSRTLRALI